MSDFFTSFAASLPLWLLPLAVLVYVWGKMVKAGLNPENNASFQRTINWLREERVEQLYLSALGGLMDRVGNLIGDRHKLGISYTSAKKTTNLTTKLFGFNPFTPESYEKCLLLAFSYPIFSFLIVWMLGGSGKVGQFDVLKAAEQNVEQRSLILIGTLLLIFWGLSFLLKQNGWRRWLSLSLVSIIFLLVSFFSTKEGLLVLYAWYWMVFLSIFMAIYSGGLLMKAIIDRTPKQAHISIYDIAFAVAFSIAVSFAVAVVLNVAVIYADADIGIGVGGPDIGIVITAVVGAVTDAVAVVITGTAAFAFVAAVYIARADYNIAVAIFSGALLVMLKEAQQWCEKRLVAHWYWVIYTTVFCIIGISLLNVMTLASYMILILFWLLLPLVNTPLDWLSLGVTRGLLQAVRSGEHSTRVALVWAAMDLVLALAFLFLITAVLVGVTSLGNAVAGKTLVDIQLILQGIKETPASVDHWWIYFMLLSTLVPTLIHFALAGGAATLWLPRKWRLSIADGLEHDVHKTQLAWVYLTFTPIAGFIVVPAALLFFLWWLVNVNGAWLGTHLLDWAQWLADTAGAF